ncbi:hypothetical protein L596_015515 [Steinernema carpocapsae]|uniref:Uncharacterized protein n=1 Tax=Steinernema carpocapsae TaxID=34508 RepID=A0A4U5NG82_STECR|nr:hypothetical protein L596_015515 [Steinernema carpocapsae]
MVSTRSVKKVPQQELEGPKRGRGRPRKHPKTVEHSRAPVMCVVPRWRMPTFKFQLSDDLLADHRRLETMVIAEHFTIRQQQLPGSEDQLLRSRVLRLLAEYQITATKHR